jgi:hypothetical protein
MIDQIPLALIQKYNIPLQNQIYLIVQWKVQIQIIWFK